MTIGLDAAPIDDPLGYTGRPGLSPAVAALVAAGLIEEEHRVLDVGCGRGQDLVALARLGCRHLTGLDYNRAALRTAKSREREALGGLGLIEWRWGSLEALLDLPPQSFDWVLDTFLLNNLDAGATGEYLRRLARVLRKDGRLLLQTRVKPRVWREAGELGVASPYFHGSKAVLTHFAENHPDGGRTYEAVVVQVLRRNGKRVPATPQRMPT